MLSTARIERDHQEQVQEKEREEEHILEVKRVEDGRVAIRILHLDGKLQNIDCQLSWNLLKLKEKISELSGVTVETQRLIYGGRVLEDDQQLASYKIEQGHTIHLFVRSVQPASENIATVSTSHFPDQRSPRDNVPPLTFVNIANEAISPSVYPSDSLQRVDPLMLDSPLGSAARRIKLWSSFFLIIYSMKAMGQFAAIADDQQNRNDRNRSSYETQYDVLTRPSTIVQCYELFVHVLAVYIGCIGFKAVHDTDIRPIRFYCRGVVWLALLTTLDQVYISLHLYTLTQAGEGYHNVYNARTPPLNEVVSANVLQTLMLIVMWVIAIHHSYVHQAEVVRYNATHLSAAINALPPA